MTLSRGNGPRRRTPLTTTTRLAPGKGLSRSTPLPRAAAPAVPRPRPQRATQGAATAIPRALATYVIERAGGCCDWCGRYCLDGWYSRQHRLPRAMGGSAGAHTAANLVLLCGSATSPGCHERAERSDIPAARAAGFRLRRGDDPETSPILRHGASWVLPTADGWIPAEEAV